MNYPQFLEALTRRAHEACHSDEHMTMAEICERSCDPARKTRAILLGGSYLQEMRENTELMKRRLLSRDYAQGDLGFFYSREGHYRINLVTYSYVLPILCPNAPVIIELFLDNTAVVYPSVKSAS